MGRTDERRKREEGESTDGGKGERREGRGKVKG